MVARKRTKADRRFGFVRFEGVRDNKQLKYQLEKIMIGNRRLFVNSPKYDKRKGHERIQEGFKN